MDLVYHCLHEASWQLTGGRNVAQKLANFSLLMM